jgi:hypothetical protein
MGFDPTRKHKRSAFDYWYVLFGVAVVVALLAWAAL